MKLLCLKITDPAGFRSLHCGFEHHFRNEWTLQVELAAGAGFAPFVCAGPNGSGKSNLLEALAAIFYHLECIYLKNLPDSFRYDEDENPEGFRSEKATPNGFEIEYLISPRRMLMKLDRNQTLAHIKIVKKIDGEPEQYLLNALDNEGPVLITKGHTFGRGVLPDYILGYSSGENEILSLPFFKMRFIQFDEYWQALNRQLDYSGQPESRLVYMDGGFSQAILLCNLLFLKENDLKLFHEDVNIGELKEFRIIVRRSIPLESEQLEAFDVISEDQRRERANKIRAEHTRATELEISNLIRQEIVNSNPALWVDADSDVIRYRLNVLRYLDGNEKSSTILSALKRCATLSYHDESTDCLVLDYWVNEATKEAVRNNFENSPLALFQAFQVLLMLNLYSVSDALKADLYRSSSHYVGETVPTLASDQRIMRFKHVKFTKRGIERPIQLKDLSDGEHQLLHSLGLCLLFRNTNSLFLLDEPETHFNPDWRANFISRLRECLPDNGNASQEMLITTHTPFLISDSREEKVLVFNKDKATGRVSITPPGYNTLGASINKITMETFHKHETIGLYANQILRDLLDDPAAQNDPHALAKRIMETIGDSIERTFAVQSVLANSGQPKFRDELD